ncbi:MAG: RluA family pseudouridine synthase [Actinomycetes bacterium]
MTNTTPATTEDEGAEHLDIVVPALMNTMRVDRALSMLTSCPRSEASRLVEVGAVTIDGKVVTKASTPLSTGAHLEAVLPPQTDGSVEAEPDVHVTVLYEDADLVVVDKPFTLVVHPGAGNTTGTLVAGLLALYPELADLPKAGFGEVNRPGIVHRLDKGTSGLLAVARSPAAFTSVSEQLATRQAQRRYVGVVEGHVESERGIVDAPIGRSATSPTRMMVRPDGKSARTSYEVIERLEGPARTVIGLSLETGRTHQIRVHMAAIGHPVVNDPRYGQRNETLLDADRLALHAGRLRLEHPVTGDEVSVLSAWPDDLRILGGGDAAQRWLENS